VDENHRLATVYDTTILTVVSGSLDASIVMLARFVVSPRWHALLFASWVFLACTIATTLIVQHQHMSHFAALSQAFSQWLFCDRTMLGDPCYTPNKAGLVYGAFPYGVVLSVLFVSLNLGMRGTMLGG
jgi:hypothetical protein